MPTHEGWLYLAVVLDVCSRAVVGWALMTLAERTEIQHKMRIPWIQDECKAIPTEYPVLLAARARESRYKACGQMKAGEV